MHLACAVMLVSAIACNKNENADQRYSTVDFKVPAGFPAPVYRFASNAVTAERFELGKKLFYDPLLSKDNSISCGSCHLQAGAFSNIDHKVSHGINGLTGSRNSPPIFNVAWQTNFFWDGGVNHIEVQPINPIQNPVEMDETLANVVLKLNASSVYKAQFLKAYGSDSITSQLMLRSISQFMSLLISADSKYDRFINKRPGGDFNAAELRGLNIFREKCASCHKEPLFTDLTYRNNGLNTDFTSDPGRALITLNADDEGKFKVPSLRNVEVSYPYMHDGSIATLEEVLDHYSSGIQVSNTLDPLLNNGILLSTTEKSDLLKFLKTLTDHSFLNNPAFAQQQPD
jgi:cytochrome c peroxidase